VGLISAIGFAESETILIAGTYMRFSGTLEVEAKIPIKTLPQLTGGMALRIDPALHSITQRSILTS
jgi:hypothetical protein